MLDVTEGIDLSLLQYPLLKRNLPSSLAALIPSSMGISIGSNGSTGNGKEKELTATAAAGKEREREKEKATTMTMGTEEEAALNETWKPQMNNDGLAVRVGQGRYKMEYVDGTSDWFVHGRTVRLRGVVHKSGDATEDVTAAEETADASPTNVSATPAKVTVNEGGGQDQQRPSPPPSFTSPPGQSAVAVALTPANNDPGPQSAQPSSSSSSSSLPLPTPSHPPTTVTTTTTITTDSPALRTFISEFVNRDRTATISQDAAAGHPTGTVIPALEPEKLRNVTEEWERVSEVL